MGITSAIEASRQSKIEQAVIEAESRLKRYDGDIVGQFGAGCRVALKALARPFRFVGAFFVGAKSEERFNEEIKRDLNKLEDMVEKKSAEWRSKNPGQPLPEVGKPGYTAEQSILDELKSKIKQAGISAESSGQFWNGHILDSLGTSRRAQFEETYRNNVINPEAGEWQRREDSRRAAAAGIAAGAASSLLNR